MTWIVPADRSGRRHPAGRGALDLAGDIARYGADTLGGVGVSRPAPRRLTRPRAGGPGGRAGPGPALR